MRATGISILTLALVVPAVQLSSQQGTAPAPAARAAVDFEKDVQPIFKASCYACHAGATPQAGLRLDVKSLALKGSNGGQVIVPGNSNDSALINRVRGLGGLRPMPLTGTPLTADQVAILTRWVDDGAQWPDALANEQNAAIQKHWAYVKPVRPVVPTVKNPAWVRNPIDAFVLARLEQEKLPPTREASKEALIRRVSLDLIGLPPSPAEVDAFLADTRPDAYERLVDRLLASPQHGERMATPWLDIARYADSNGATNDHRRLGAYRYRDWVIAAFNKNMPFDKFVIEQLAGDMLPNATNDQRIATGFVRASMWNDEGGTDPEEQMWISEVDRTNTIGTGLLGSSVGCSQCHNHKYDPFLQKDFYALLAFFDNSKYDPNALPGGNVDRKKWTETLLEVTTPELAAKRDAIRAQIKETQEQIKVFPNSFALWQAWEKSLIDADKQWTVLHPTQARGLEGTTLTVSPDGSVLASGAEPDFDTYVIEAPIPVSGTITGIQVEAIPHAGLDAGRDPNATIGGPGRDFYGNFKVHRVDVEVGPAAKLAKVAIKPTVQPAGTDEVKGYDPNAVVVDDNANGGVGVQVRIPQVWQSDVLLDLEADQAGQRVARRLVVVPDKPLTVTTKDVVRITIVHKAEAMKSGLGNFRLAVTTQAEPYKVVLIDARRRPLLGVPWEQRVKPAENAKADAPQEAPYEKDPLFNRWREVAVELKPLRDKVTDLENQVKALGIYGTPVLQENLDVAHPSTKLRIRGAFTDKAEDVPAAVPGFLGALPADGPQNRLGLAQWLVGPDNPLTARVRMNQIWQQYFGRGIVETTEDFGTQGSRPSHPELLDWLAVEFQSNGWDQNAMTRMILTSNTYRQSSAATPELLERDQSNVLLARGPRFRVESEMIRDISLAASGLLSTKMGGPGVMPPQPEGIYVFPAQDNDDEWITAKGEDRYRRGLYTFVRRTLRYPSLMVFDAPSREYATVRRSLSDTPLQALTALNDPAFFEAAQAMARRILKEGGADATSRATYGFRLATSRKPGAGEVKVLVTAFENEQKRFQANKAIAEAVAGTPDAELAAWTMVSNALLNLDSTVTKE